MEAVNLPYLLKGTPYPLSDMSLFQELFRFEIKKIKFFFS